MTTPRKVTKFFELLESGCTLRLYDANGLYKCHSGMLLYCCELGPDRRWIKSEITVCSLIQYIYNTGFEVVDSPSSMNQSSTATHIRRVEL